jgi:hypothetical protein
MASTSAASSSSTAASLAHPAGNSRQATLGASLHSTDGFAALLEQARRPYAPAPLLQAQEWLGGVPFAEARTRHWQLQASLTSSFAGLMPSPSTAGAVAVPALVRQGRDESGVRFFLHQRPFRQRASKTANEFLDLWISRSYVASADAFPATHRSSPAVFVHEIVLNPIEAAALALREKNVSLVDAIERAAAGPDRAADQDFTSKLAGVVDAAVAGGIVNYRGFFTGEFARSHPEIADDMEGRGPHSARSPFRAQKREIVGVLRQVLLEQLAILARGIRVHGVKCGANMLPLHDFMCARFETMRRTVVELVTHASAAAAAAPAAAGAAGAATGGAAGAAGSAATSPAAGAAATAGVGAVPPPSLAPGAASGVSSSSTRGVVSVNRATAFAPPPQPAAPLSRQASKQSMPMQPGFRGT